MTYRRDPQNRLKNVNGTVHWAVDGKPMCGRLATASAWLTPSVATVTCLRCIKINGGDVAGHVDPPVEDNPHRARREAERAARRAARTAHPNEDGVENWRSDQVRYWRNVARQVSA